MSRKKTPEQARQKAVEVETAIRDSYRKRFGEVRKESDLGQLIEADVQFNLKTLSDLQNIEEAFRRGGQIADSTPLSAEERKSINKFFWSHFK